MSLDYGTVKLFCFPWGTIYRLCTSSPFRYSHVRSTVIILPRPKRRSHPQCLPILFHLIIKSHKHPLSDIHPTSSFASPSLPILMIDMRLSYDPHPPRQLNRATQSEWRHTVPVRAVVPLYSATCGALRSRKGKLDVGT